MNFPSLPRPLHVIDANCLISGINQLYGRKVFPTLWNKIGDFIDNGVILLIPEVIAQIEKKDDDVKSWIQPYKQKHEHFMDLEKRVLQEVVRIGDEHGSSKTSYTDLNLGAVPDNAVFCRFIFDRADISVSIKMITKTFDEKKMNTQRSNASTLPKSEIRGVSHEVREFRPSSISAPWTLVSWTLMGITLAACSGGGVPTITGTSAVPTDIRTLQQDFEITVEATSGLIDSAPFAVLSLFI